MAARSLETEVDRLYQLPLSEFTAARNALARKAGTDGAEIRNLSKPPIAAWAVNQVYWHDRETYDALVEAAKDLRAAHAAVLSGKRVDLRTAGKVHEQALEAATRSALAILQQAGHPATEATRQAISTTLRGLPAADPPGRLSRTLSPGGFELLSGIPVRQPARKGEERRARRDTSTRETRGAGRSAAHIKAVARAKNALASAVQELRSAEHAARRSEFEAARTARDAEKAARAVEEARGELESAQRAVTAAEREAASAQKQRETAERRAREAEEAVSTARARVDAAQTALDSVNRRAD